jgi:hypothetical protein
MKNILTILLLFIIAVQILPVKELSNFLDDKEYVEDDYCEDVEKEKKFDTDIILFQTFYQAPKLAKKTQNHFPIAATGLHPYPISDVATPPPNTL